MGMNGSGSVISPVLKAMADLERVVSRGGFVRGIYYQALGIMAGYDANGSDFAMKQCVSHREVLVRNFKLM